MIGNGKPLPFSFICYTKNTENLNKRYQRWMNKKRKMKKYIPYGLYCYTIVGQGTNGILKTKRCSFFKYMGFKIYEGEYQGKPYKEDIPVYKCMYCQCTSDEEFLLSDSVKICGVHDN